MFYEQKNAFLVGRVLEKNLMQQLMPNLMPNLMPQLMLQLMLKLMLQLMLELDCGPSTMIDFNMVRVASGLS